MKPSRRKRDNVKRDQNLAAHGRKPLGAAVTSSIDHDAMGWVDRLTDLLDTKLRIPGTRIRFGVDFLLGLIPGAGDVISLGLSAVLVATMARQGATPMLVIKMLGNVLLDAMVGSIPILGNLFDLYFKANIRNVKLMREHYHDGKHRGAVWPMLVVVLAAVFAMTIVALWLIFKLVAWLASGS